MIASILRVGRRGGLFLLKQHMTTVGWHDGSYDTWHAEERDDDDDETTTRQRHNNFRQWFTPLTHSHMNNMSRWGTPLT